jgi:phospholipase/carboxylesterase
MSPHANSPVVHAGPALEQADAIVILVHGRGATAESMVALFEELAVPRCAAVAPQAAGHAWYPHSFLAPLESNQPYLDSALDRLESLVQELLSRGISEDRIALLGFSQGACLALEFVARYPRKYGAIMGLTGGLIGPPGTPRNYAGSLQGVSVFLGSSDPDPHVPFARVQETRDVLQKIGATVDLRRYPNMGHTINENELSACRSLLGDVAEHA